MPQRRRGPGRHSTHPLPEPPVPGRLIRALGQPHLPALIWQRPFESDRGHYRRLCDPETPADCADLAEYFLDWRHGPDFQPDLAAWVLPLGLEAWARRLLDLPDPARIAGDWHFEGMQEAFQARPPAARLPEAATEALHAFCIDTALARMGAETRLVVDGGMSDPAYGWVDAHQSVLWLWPALDALWQRWWAMEAEGHALCAVQWLSVLLCEDGDNPVFPPWTPARGGGPFCLWDFPGLCQGPAPAANIAMLRTTLGPGWIAAMLDRAAGRLARHPERAALDSLRAGLPRRMILAEERIPCLLWILAHPGSWSFHRCDEIAAGMA